MFKENFERYCNIVGKSPSAVCHDIGLSNSAYSLWTETTVPRRVTLLKIADYFGVSPDELLADTPWVTLSTNATFDLNAITQEDIDLITAYRQSSSDTKKAVRAVLGIAEGDHKPELRIAAFGGDNKVQSGTKKPKIT